MPSPETAPTAVVDGSISVTDTISHLRHDLARKEMTAIAAPSTPSGWRSLMRPPSFNRRRPRALEAGPSVATPAAPAEPTTTSAPAPDVYAALASLAEPAPLPVDDAIPNVFAPPPPPGATAFLDDVPLPAQLGTSDPILVESAAAAETEVAPQTGADAPPIDVHAWAPARPVPEQERETAEVTSGARRWGAADTATDAATDMPTTPNPWSTPAVDAATDVWSTPATDAWNAIEADGWASNVRADWLEARDRSWAATGHAPPPATEDRVEDRFDAPWARVDAPGASTPWSAPDPAWDDRAEAASSPADAPVDTPADLYTTADLIPQGEVNEAADAEPGAGDEAPSWVPPWSSAWASIAPPNPEATSTGFYVDWGTPEESSEHTSADTLAEPPADESTGPAVEAEIDDDAFDHRFAQPDPTVGAEASSEFTFEIPEALRVPGEPVAAETEPAHAPAPDPGPIGEPAPDLDEPAPIVWRLDEAAVAVVAVAEEIPSTWDASGSDERGPDEHWPDEHWVVAGPDWHFGDTAALQVSDGGGLVMRRADERWALADVTVSDRFIVEVEVDYRSGPGFGVLFRADLDDDDHLSGYSFDIDPAYEGGCYLVRQWIGDRELWNPLAKVAMSDAGIQRGHMTVRLVVEDDALQVLINGETILAVGDLGASAAERGHEPVRGARVGIQSWSSTDMVLDVLRVAGR